MFPGIPPGSVMVWLPDDGGTILAGDCAVGPGPQQGADAPALQRPKMEDAKAFATAWKQVMADRPVAAILPLHGKPCLRSDHGDGFEAAVANIWTVCAHGILPAERGPRALSGDPRPEQPEPRARLG